MKFPFDLLHYTYDPDWHLVRQRSYEQYVMDKPDGLWVSYEGGGCDITWLDYCKSIGFYSDIEASVRAYRVSLKPTANLLWLETIEEVSAFTASYVRDIFGLESVFLRHLAIDWISVARQWQGIVISPYHLQVRMDSRCAWYGSWDCSSGCIWDLEAIASIDLLSV